MDMREARLFVLTFGKYKARPICERTLDAIAESDEGLLYLDWLRGSLHERCLDWQKPTREALDAYLEDATIARELKGLLSARRTMPRRGAFDYAQAARAVDCGY